jgi:spermidine synthase
VKPWSTLARAPGLEGQELVLQQRDGVFVIRSGGRELMSSVRHHSEEAMARIGLSGLRAKAPTVLIGGLGLGYTVRATLDALAGAGRVVVSEISEAVVEWNRGVLAELAGRPLDDARVEIARADVAEVMREGKGRFDCILLDVDNGPSAMSAQRNQQLYEAQGIAVMKAALRPGGVAVIWSAGPDDAFLKRLGKAGLEATVERSVARQGGSAAHVLFVAKR